MNNKLWIFFLQLILICKLLLSNSCPNLALVTICGKNKACSGGNGGTTFQNKACGARRYPGVGTELRVEMWLFDFVIFWQLISSMFISRSGNMNQYANSNYLCLCVSCVNVIVEDGVRTAKVRCRSSHRKSASLKSPRNCQKKKAANDLLQWPTSPKWHIFAHLLDCSTVPPCADWGSAVIGLSPREAETWNSLAHALTEFRIGKRILVDDLRSYRRRRSKQDATLASSGVKIPVNVKMSASMGSSIIQSRSWHEYSGSNEPEQSACWLLMGWCLIVISVFVIPGGVSMVSVDSQISVYSNWHIRILVSRVRPIITGSDFWHMGIQTPAWP